MDTDTALFDGFNDKATTTLDPIADADMDMGGSEENTPAIMDPCPECGRRLTRLADWMPPPASRDEAWHGWVQSCVATQSSLWQWCPLTGWLTARVRVYWPQAPATAASKRPPSNATAGLPVARRLKVAARRLFMS